MLQVNDVTETEPSMLYFALANFASTMKFCAANAITRRVLWLVRNRETVCASISRLIQNVLLEKSVSLRRKMSEAVSALHRIRLHYATQYRGVPTTSSVAKFVAMVFFQR